MDACSRGAIQSASEIIMPRAKTVTASYTMMTLLKKNDIFFHNIKCLILFYSV